MKSREGKIKSKGNIQRRGRLKAIEEYEEGKMKRKGKQKKIKGREE